MLTRDGFGLWRNDMRSKLLLIVLYLLTQHVQSGEVQREPKVLWDRLVEQAQMKSRLNPAEYEKLLKKTKERIQERVNNGMSQTAAELQLIKDYLADNGPKFVYGPEACTLQELYMFCHYVRVLQEYKYVFEDWERYRPEVFAWYTYLMALEVTK